MSRTETTDYRTPEMRGHHAGQHAYEARKGPEAPPGSMEWQRGYVRGWVFAALRDQDSLP